MLFDGADQSQEERAALYQRIAALENEMRAQGEALRQATQETENQLRIQAQTLQHAAEETESLRTLYQGLVDSGGQERGRGERRMGMKERVSAIKPYKEASEWPRFLQQLRLMFGPVHSCTADFIRVMRQHRVTPDHAMMEQVSGLNVVQQKRSGRNSSRTCGRSWA